MRLRMDKTNGEGEISLGTRQETGWKGGTPLEVERRLVVKTESLWRPSRRLATKAELPWILRKRPGTGETSADSDSGMGMVSGSSNRPRNRPRNRLRNRRGFR